MRLNKQLLRQLVLEVLDEEQLSLPGMPPAVPAQQQAATQQQNPVATVVDSLLAALKAKNINGYDANFNALKNKTPIDALKSISGILVNVLAHKSTVNQTTQDALKTSFAPPAQPAAAAQPAAQPGAAVVRR